MSRIVAKDLDLAAAGNVMDCEWLSTAALMGVKLPLNNVNDTLDMIQCNEGQGSCHDLATLLLF